MKINKVLWIGDYNVVFEITERYEHLYMPVVWYRQQKQHKIPLLIDELQINQVEKMLNKMSLTEIPFNLFHQVVAGACSYAIKRSMVK